jgi:DNA end-binding protein Ku
MHNREYTCILRPVSKGLMLHTMYYQDEIRKVEQFGREEGEVRAAELKIAQQLIEALSAKWEPEKYQDTFEQNLKQMIRARLEGKEVEAVEKPTPPPPTPDLMSALKQSLAQMGKKPPQRVTRTEAARAPSRQARRGRKKAA